ncbi:hypothetical protein HELRODRAFT_183542 [Helobdella robusta]|uniref:HMG box domain-containing protein n=1 Tax=Helobdella robusta TaxID=6412 RepID=T1FJT7_HELRO|nr:hypothetical protein HELRODRAFT_183542 [Helobdella robusta]ESO10513.1 hypothetical protein HELRODRAFT_183542 [Helobdella robusta]
MPFREVAKELGRRWLACENKEKYQIMVANDKKHEREKELYNGGSAASASTTAAAFKLAHPYKSAQSLQSDTNAFCCSVKGKDDVTDLVQKKLCELGNVEQKNAANLLSFWSKQRHYDKESDKKN